jgi:hypothetical protein
LVKNRIGEGKIVPKHYPTQNDERPESGLSG